MPREKISQARSYRATQQRVILHSANSKITLDLLLTPFPELACNPTAPFSLALLRRLQILPGRLHPPKRRYKRPVHTHRHLRAQSGPQFRIRPVDWRIQDPTEHLQLPPGRVALQLRLQVPRVQTHTHDARRAAVSACELGRVQDVAGF